MKKIIFTGGGSSGHVVPNLALMAGFDRAAWDIRYVGSYAGIERALITQENIPYYPIASGKLRRYFSWRTFVDPFKILFGFFQALYYCLRIRPAVVFSKGGFVAVPVVMAAWLCRIPVVTHESDLTPGLANKLCFPFAKRVCVTFQETLKYLPKTGKVTVTGTPVRKALFAGDAERGRQLCGFSREKPIIIVMGGGLGSVPINNTVRAALPQLLSHYQVVHICGKGKTDPTLDHTPGYRQFDYVDHELADLYACADLVISRAGANAIYELIALKKPHILIPLSAVASRGDQIINAKHFASLGLSDILNESDLNEQTLLDALQQLGLERESRIAKLSAYPLPDAVHLITALINGSEYNHV